MSLWPRMGLKFAARRPGRGQSLRARGLLLNGPCMFHTAGPRPRSPFPLREAGSPMATRPFFPSFLFRLSKPCRHQEYLKTTPSSRLIVNLVSEELIRLRVASAKPEETRKSREAVQAAIKILVATQRPDGGWGYWPESGATSAHLTAYVFWGLTQAEKAGFDVDGLVMRRADQYLREALSRPLIDRWFYSLSNTERAQVVFMLSERDTQGLSGYAESLYEKRNTLSSFGKAFLAMAFGNFEKNSLQTKSKTLLGDIRNSVVYLDPTRAYVKEGEGWETYWSSDLRSTSIYLMALLRLDSNNADVEKVLRYIIENRKDGHWATTNDTSMTLMSIIEYVRQNPIDKHPTDVSLLVDDVLRETLPFT